MACVEDCYGWTRKLLESYLHRLGIEHTFVEGTDPADFEAAIRPNTRVIFLESPTTFTFKLQDLANVARIARARGIKTVIDSTWASPIFLSPIDYGIDLVVHSVSKYMGGAQRRDRRRHCGQRRGPRPYLENGTGHLRTRNWLKSLVPVFDCSRSSVGRALSKLTDSAGRSAAACRTDGATGILDRNNGLDLRQRHHRVIPPHVFAPFPRSVW